MIWCRVGGIALYESDKNTLKNNDLVSDSVVNSFQLLIRDYTSNIASLQDTLGSVNRIGNLKFHRVHALLPDHYALQAHHLGDCGHWVVSTVGAWGPKNQVFVLDSKDGLATRSKEMQRQLSALYPQPDFKNKPMYLAVQQQTRVTANIHHLIGYVWTVYVCKFMCFGSRKGEIITRRLTIVFR